MVPRVIVLAGKAAPDSYNSKLIIKLANDIAEVVNKDPDTSDMLQLIFLPNYGVSLAELIFPSSDLSEQISTAGHEASGTGNMKFAFNGALTIASWSGANLEIREAVGEENIFMFGLQAKEIEEKRKLNYHPMDCYKNSAELRQTLEAIANGIFSSDDADRFQPIIASLLQHDPYMIVADFMSYIQCQEKVDRTFQDEDLWTQKSILNVARVGKFSSDQTILGYAKEIWNLDFCERKK